MLRCRYFYLFRWALAFGLGLLAITYMFRLEYTKSSIVILAGDGDIFIELRPTPPHQQIEPVKGTETQTGCRLPNVNPFDPRVTRFMRGLILKIKCEKWQKAATHLDQEGRLTVNEDVVQEDGISRIRYRFLMRPPGNDYHVKRGNWTMLWEAGKPVIPVSVQSEDFTQLEVTWREGVRYEVHMRAAVQEAVRQRPVLGGGLRDHSDAQPMSVVIVMTDSIAHNQFQRRGRQTYRYLKKDPNTVILQGQTIVGDGTTAQITGMLTGIPFFEILESRKSFPGPATVDTWPFIFPDFKKHGYATLFSEDDPTFGVFNLRLHGFRDPPTDHYGRYFWMGVGLAKKHLCVGKLKTHEMQMNYARSLFDAYPRNPKFAFVMLSELTHNKPNRFQLMDVDLLGFIDSMKRAGHLDNTMFIIMSDHGSRYHKVRRSVNGKLEERLPMFALMMPPWFAANYPNLFANLKENSKQLTTPFDIHATLSHVLSYPDLPPRDKESFGQSLFSQIDKMRGCEEAGVEFHWCPCVSSSEMNSSSAQARDLAATVISFMNDLTSNHTDLCERLTLKEIGYVGRLMVHKKLHQFLGNSRKRVPRFNDSQVAQGDGEVFEIRLTTSPNDGAYEATAHLVGGTFHVMGDISRVNAYGDQPKCLLQKHAYLRKYCYCKKKTT